MEGFSSATPLKGEIGISACTLTTPLKAKIWIANNQLERIKVVKNQTVGSPQVADLLVKTSESSIQYHIMEKFQTEKTQGRNKKIEKFPS